MANVTDKPVSGNGHVDDVETTLLNQAPAESATPDPFDSARLRLSQDFAASVGVKKALLSIPVRKPSKEWFVRVHPNEAYRITTAVIELKEEDRDVYLVDPSLREELATESTMRPMFIFLAINRQANLFLWPIPIPDPNGRKNEWNRTLLEAAQMAQSDWVRVQANMSLGAYDVFIAANDAPVEWPDKPQRRPRRRVLQVRKPPTQRAV